jgi:hypothetical protein
LITFNFYEKSQNEPGKSYQDSYQANCLLSSLLTLLHVFLERRSLLDVLAGVFVLLGSHVTGVVFTSHGPAEFGGLAPVRLLVEQSRAGEGGLGRSKGGGTSHKGGDDGKFGLSR